MEKKLKIRIRRINMKNDDLPLPQYATPGSAGMDLFAANEDTIEIAPNETALIPTGLSIELPIGYEAQIRPRSGLALKHEIGILNSPGTIDSDYRGEIKVIIKNFGSQPFVVHRGDRIAQMVITRYERIDWVETNSITESIRGTGGFGHTGLSFEKK